MFSLRKLLFGGAASPVDLAPDVREALAAWRAQPAVALDNAHFHTRYVVLDVATAGLNAETDALQGVAAVGMSRGGVVVPGDILYIDLSEGAVDDAAALDRRLMALLQFSGKCPLASYRVPFVAGFLQRIYRERLGLDFQPVWVDLAWLLADLFKEISDTVASREVWLEAFGLEGSAGRDPVENALVLAKLLQIALPRAAERGMDTPGRLVDSAQARRFLRQSA